MPRIRRVLETAIYVDDMERAVNFYREVLGLEPLSTGERLTALDAGGGSVFLIFHREYSRQGVSMDGGWVPPHDASGPMHFAFAIDPEELEPWRRRLEERGVEIESEVTWPGGGESLYFRDPDGHSVELATPGIWPD